MKKQIVLLMLCSPLMAMAQREGRVTDEKGEALAYANVVALTAKDSSFVAGTTTDDNGRFNLPQAREGMLLRTSLVGFKTHYIIIGADHSPVNINLQSDTKALGEVVVRASRPRTQATAEGMRTLVMGTLLEQTTDINDLLSLIPQISANNGAVTVFGRGTPDIYINGKKMQSTQELEQLRPTDIKSVEVINNPGARYRRDVKSVIRIVTKRPTGEGFRFDDRQTATWQERGYLQTSNDLNLGWRSGRWDFTSELFGRYGARGDKRDAVNETRQATDYTSVIHLTDYDKRDLLYCSLSASYQLGDEGSIGASITADDELARPFEMDLYNELFEDGVRTEFTKNRNKFHYSNSSLAANAYYIGKIKQLGIDLNLDYYGYKRRNDMDGRQMDVAEPWESTAAEATATRQNDKSHLWSARLNLTHPLWGGTLGAGGEAGTVKRTSTSHVASPTLEDETNTKINEDMWAGYMEYTHKVGPVELKGGLRYEWVGFDYYDHDIHQDEQSKTYARFFPSLSTSMPWGKTEWQLTYGKDVDRPPYYALSSRIDYINSYTYQTGNPLLMPSYTTNVGLNFSWKWLSISSMYKHIEGQISNIMNDYKGNPRVGIYSWTNLQPYDAYSVSLQAAPSFGIYQPVWSVNFYHQFLELANSYGKEFEHPLVNVSMNHRFRLPFGLVTLENTISTTGDYGTSYVSRGQFVTNVKYQTQLLNKKLIIDFNIYDVLHTGKESVWLYSGGNRRIAVFNYPGTYAFVSLRYRFNAAESKYKGGGSSSQRSRM